LERTPRVGVITLPVHANLKTENGRKVILGGTESSNCTNFRLQERHVTRSHNDALMVFRTYCVDLTHFHLQIILEVLIGHNIIASVCGSDSRL
jgi:hypothetical protein